MKQTIAATIYVKSAEELTAFENGIWNDRHFKLLKNRINVHCENGISTKVATTLFASIIEMSEPVNNGIKVSLIFTANNKNLFGMFISTLIEYSNNITINK